MNKLKIISSKKLFALLGGIALVIVAITVSTYFLYIIPSQETAKLEFERQKYEDKQSAIEKKQKESADAKEQADMEEEELKASLSYCLGTAYSSYVDSWNTMCPLWKRDVKREWDLCKANAEDAYDYDQAIAWCWANTPDYEEQEDNGRCLLPSKYSNSIDESYSDSKKDCNSQFGS